MFKRIVTRWLASDIRQRYLLAKYRFSRRLNRIKPGEDVAEVYISLNDPYSFLLIQVLDELQNRFNIRFQLFITHGAVLGRAGHKSLWRDWALKDAQALASQYQLIPPKNYPEHQTLVSAQQKWQILPKSIANACEIFAQTWSNTLDIQYLPSTPVINHQVKNLSKMLSKGHEISGSIYFAGQWYWGIDSLEHIERALEKLNLVSDLELGSETKPTTGSVYKEKQKELSFPALQNQLPQSQVEESSLASSVFYNKSKLQLLTDKGQLSIDSTLEVFVSIRSPYSYLGLIQAKRLADVYGVKLEVKLVLPILMRGGEISVDKQKYIFQDAAREAKVLNIPFKQLTDPIGEGVFNCYRYFGYAEQNGEAFEYMKAMFEAVFVNNIDLKIPKNINKMFDRLSLSFVDAQAYAAENDWQLMTDKNQLLLDAMGYWGVPCFAFQNANCWGQDRLWQIEDEVLKRLKSNNRETI